MLNQVEKHLVKSVDYLKGLGLETFLSGSTLLQIIRSKKYEIRHELDREVNLGCRAEDFTKEMLFRIEEDFNYILKGDGYIIFGEQSRSCWENGKCFTFLGFHERVGKNRVEMLDGGVRLVWKSSYTDKYRKIKYKGYEFNVPTNTRGWLKDYFGEGWKKEDLTWNWSKAENIL